MITEIIDKVALIYSMDDMAHWVLIFCRMWKLRVCQYWTQTAKERRMKVSLK